MASWIHYVLAIPLLCKYPELYHMFTEKHVWECLAVLFIIALNKKQPKCPFRIGKLWNIYTNGILHSSNKLSNMDECHKNIKWKDPDIKGYIQFDSISIQFRAMEVRTMIPLAGRGVVPRRRQGRVIWGSGGMLCLDWSSVYMSVLVLWKFSEL